MNIEKIHYHGWPNCYRLANGQVELVVMTDVGPRIIRFGFPGEANEFYEDPRALGLMGGDTWQLYGGHRLWHAPEIDGRTNAPDNVPVQFEPHDGFARVIQTPENETIHIQKEMDISLAADATQVQLVHRLRNTGVWPVELAPWSLSVMAGGGRAIIPLPPRGTHPEDLLPTGNLVLWAYVDMSDPRWTWGRQYILLQQQAGGAPQKIGLGSAEGWLAYANHGHLFVKTHRTVPGAVYPDKGSSVEVFTNSDMLELETLGPVVILEPGAAVEHVEHWWLFRDVAEPQNDADVRQNVLPRIQTALSPG
ncbi:MAG: hypothetical protein HZC41_07600 [Chloroflexi bacterium]|nr:hypothetical protein [Chloroflexota bacterium]